MRRMLLVLSVALVMAAMIAVSAMTAFAQGTDTAPNCAQGNNKAYYSPGADNRSAQATESLNKVYRQCDISSILSSISA